MVDINLPNFITVGLIAVLALFLIRLVFKSMGKTAPV